MNEQEARSLIVSTGKELLSDKLVARTWGNVSSRLLGTSFLITPSGRDYMSTAEQDLAIYDYETDEWTGPYKPSSEKGVHAVAYELFPEVGFVIHTHQAYASAIGVYGVDTLDITKEEEEKLGGICEAAYGLPGTKKLKEAVQKAMETGAHTVFMKHHGVVIAGVDKEEAYERILLLEEICRRNWDGRQFVKPVREDERYLMEKAFILSEIKEEYPFADWADTEAVITWSKGKKTLKAQLDDMAQMIGRSVPRVDYREDQIEKVLKNGNAVFVKGFGAVVCGRDEDDTEALKLLLDKACITALHTHANQVKGTLSLVDCELMHAIYQKKYSKLK